VVCFKSSVKTLIHDIVKIGAGNFEYGNFKNGNFDTNLSLKNRKLVCLKTSDGNFEFIIKNSNFDNVVRTYETYKSHNPGSNPGTKPVCNDKSMST